MLCILHGFSEKEPMHSLLIKGGSRPIHRPFLLHTAMEFFVPVEIPEAIVISSARTLEYWGEWRDFIQKHGVKVYAIGPKTSKKLLQSGIHAVVAEGSGLSVMKRVQQDRVSSFLHIGAETISKTLSNAMKEVNIPYSRVVVYKSIAHPQFEIPKEVDRGCLNSERCARIWAKYGFEIPVLCLGQSTAQEAKRLGLKIIAVAAQPTREELVRIALKG